MDAALCRCALWNRRSTLAFLRVLLGSNEIFFLTKYENISTPHVCRNCVLSLHLWLMWMFSWHQVSRGVSCPVPASLCTLEGLKPSLYSLGPLLQAAERISSLIILMSCMLQGRLQFLNIFHIKRWIYWNILHIFLSHNIFEANQQRILVSHLSGSQIVFWSV